MSKKIIKTICRNGLSALFFIFLAFPAMAAMEAERTHFIWGNFPVMFGIDIVIVVSAIAAVYYGSKLLGGELKGAFNFVFAGVILISLAYLLDIFAMITNNMDLMEFIHLDLLWIINAISFISITIGFYKMHLIFAELQSKRLI